MESMSVGDLVKVGGAGPELDGIVFDMPSHSKVVVAVMDPTRGPRFQTVKPTVLGERTDAGPHDHALHALIRRTPPPVHGRGGGSEAGGRGSSGYRRGAAHRSTGR